jgi:aminomethyltransferase
LGSVRAASAEAERSAPALAIRYPGARNDRPGEADPLKHSVLLPLHTAAEARLQAASEPPQLLTYGDVPAEYRAATGSAAMFDETDRGRLEVGGADAPAFLHRLLANDVRGLAPGGGSRNLLLSSKGKVLFDFDLFRRETDCVLSLPPGKSAALAAALDMYLFSEKVAIRDTSESYAPIALVGPAAATVIAAVLGPLELPAEDYTWTATSFAGAVALVVRQPIAGSPGWRVVLGPAEAPLAWTRLRDAGVQPAGVIVRDILRVEAGAAAYGEDIDENVYPQEARLESAFSLEKGCYIGQEVVAKIDTYGGLNKRLVGLKIGHDEPVERGTRLYKVEEGERRDLGVVTSWAYSFVLDTGMALAYVKRRHQAPGTEFEVGDTGAKATIVPIPVRADAVPVTGGFEG